MQKVKNISKVLHICFLGIALTISSCSNHELPVINIGFIGPITGNANDLGYGPAKAMQLAVEEYNQNKLDDEPRVNFFFEDDEWKKENALPLYNKLRKEHNIDILFISNTDGTVALKNKVLEDGVVMINSLNNDEFLSALDPNIFKIGKKTEEAAEVIGSRIVELGIKKVYILHVTNDFMTRSAKSMNALLQRESIESKIISVDIGKTNYDQEIKEIENFKPDAIAFFGYKNLGFAMKNIRKKGISTPFFASTTTLGNGYFENSEGTLIGTEFSFFTASDGNYTLATEFLKKYKTKFNETPFSVWPAMQAYDAINITLNKLKDMKNKEYSAVFSSWLKEQIHKTSYYQGVCGNIAIDKNGASKGIYFSLYEIKGNGIIEKVKR